MENSVIRLVSDNTRAIPREHQLSVILSITMKMLENANNNDWKTVIDLESQRTDLIADFFAAPVPGEDAHAVAHCINKILEADKRLIELGDKECHHLKENLQKINHGKRALKVYTADR